MSDFTIEALRDTQRHLTFDWKTRAYREIVHLNKTEWNLLEHRFLPYIARTEPHFFSTYESASMLVLDTFGIRYREFLILDITERFKVSEDDATVQFNRKLIETLPDVFPNKPWTAVSKHTMNIFSAFAFLQDPEWLRKEAFSVLHQGGGSGWNERVTEFFQEFRKTPSYILENPKLN